MAQPSRDCKKRRFRGVPHGAADEDPKWDGSPDRAALAAQQRLYGAAANCKMTRTVPQ